jgi:DNA-binding response OmpR family regulator
LIAATVVRARHGEVVVRAALAAESPPGAPVTSQRGPWAILSVALRGNGLTSDSLQAMLEETASLDEEASVLPPADCRRALADMGGHLWIGMEAGSPELRVLLPLRAVASAEADVEPLRRVLGGHLPKRGDPARRLLLLVEEQQLRQVIAVELDKAGYRVMSARDGGEVLSLARAEPPDLILVDILARDPSAFDIALVLKQDPRTARIPLLFLTSVRDPEAGVRMGAVDFVVRPTGTGALISAIESALHSLEKPVSRVLVVEPDEALRETMVMMIQAQGYRVTEATGPEEALVLAERVQPGLVLVDAALAQERDYWLLRGLRQASADMPVFIMAEALSEIEGRAAVSRGASGYTQTGKLPDLLNRVRAGKPKP